MIGAIRLAVIAGALAFCAAIADEPAARTLFTWPQFLPHAHSHNDYEQKHPLLDALASGIGSVEADIYLEGDTILVAHDRGKWRGDFETLYLKPLNQRWQENILPVRGGQAFLLWLDIKDASAALRSKLHELLKSYPVTRAADSSRARVEIILTGNQASKEAFVTEYPSELISRDSNSFSEDDPSGSASWTWYSLDWTKIGTWAGDGAMPTEEREQLRALVTKIHAKRRKLRLWKHPATLNFWQEAISAGVDRLGTDVMPKEEG